MNIPLIGERAQLPEGLLKEMPSAPITVGGVTWVGKSIYDEFAVAALQGLLQGLGGSVQNYKPQQLHQLCIKSYQMAQWMMEARKAFLQFLNRPPEQDQAPQGPTIVPEPDAEE